MANVQIDDGNFLRVHTGIYDALARTRIPGEARQLFDFILRKTYGYGKKSDWISLGQFQKGTGINDKASIVRGLRKLERMNLIGKKVNGVDQKVNGYGVTYWINKDYDTWRPLTKKSTLANTSTTVGEYVNKPLTNKSPTKDNITKDNITKDRIRESTDSPTLKEKKPRKEPSGDHAYIIKYFCDSHEQVKGIRYLFEGGKHGKMIADLLKHYGRNDLEKIIDAFFATDDAYYAKVGYTIETLRQQANTVAQKVIGKTSYDNLKAMTTEELENLE